ncbi:MAG: hypothetical protein Q8R92_01290 [Deltaproteobacteria bacterium]|nr:hypothetical protein [Deltaproteobacteria bacterium]
MAGGKRAVPSGQSLEDEVAGLGRKLGLNVQRQVKVGRRLWGAERRIDLVLTYRESRRSIGIECKAQAARGTAEEKIPAIISDIDAWPIKGLVVFAGEGFSGNMQNYLFSTGKAVAFEDLEAWLRLYFGLD